MYVLVVAISGGDVVATSVVAKSAPSAVLAFRLDKLTNVFSVCLPTFSVKGQEVDRQRESCPNSRPG